MLNVFLSLLRYAVILAFDVRIEREAQEMADSLGVKIFSADIIYHLFDKFKAYREVRANLQNLATKRNDCSFLKEEVNFVLGKTKCAFTLAPFYEEVKEKIMPSKVISIFRLSCRKIRKATTAIPLSKYIS